MSGGTPPTSPRFGAPRYSDTTDTASFSADVNAITDALDFALKLIPTIVTVTTTATPGELVLSNASAAIAVTLPASPNAGDLVGAQVINASISGSNPVTITAGGSSHIYGAGANGLTSILLGSLGARVVLMYDGTNWQIVGGQQDSGWKALSLVNGWAAQPGAYPPAFRLRGDTVFLRGELNGSGATGSTIATLPTGYHPAAGVVMDNTSDTIDINTSGDISASAPGGFYWLDSLDFSLF